LRVRAGFGNKIIAIGALGTVEGGSDRPARSTRKTHRNGTSCSVSRLHQACAGGRAGNAGVISPRCAGDPVISIGALGRATSCSQTLAKLISCAGAGGRGVLIGNGGVLGAGNAGVISPRCAGDMVISIVALGRASSFSQTLAKLISCAGSGGRGALIGNGGVLGAGNAGVISPRCAGDPVISIVALGRASSFSQTLAKLISCAGSGGRGALIVNGGVLGAGNAGVISPRCAGDPVISIGALVRASSCSQTLAKLISCAGAGGRGVLIGNGGVLGAGNAGVISPRCAGDPVISIVALGRASGFSQTLAKLTSCAGSGGRGALIGNGGVLGAGNAGVISPRCAGDMVISIGALGRATSFSQTLAKLISLAGAGGRGVLIGNGGVLGTGNAFSVCRGSGRHGVVTLIARDSGAAHSRGCLDAGG